MRASRFIGGPASNQRGLFSRLGSGQRQLDLERSVVDHIRALLNARAGESPSAPDFGLVDFTDVVHQIPEAVQTIQKSIRDCILKYEPRVLHVSVRFVPSEDPLRLRFDIVGRLDGPERRLVRLSTLFAPGGRVHVG